MAKLHRDGNGDPEPVHVEVGEPVILQARSAAGRKIATRARKFFDLLDARRKLAEAEKAAEQSKNDYGLVQGVTRRVDRQDDDPLVVVSASRRRSDPAPDSGLRIRDGGSIVGSTDDDPGRG